MERNLEGFLTVTDSMYEALYEIDFKSSPKEWIQQKLRVLTHIDQILRSVESIEEQNIINARYRGAYDCFDHFATAELKSVLELPYVQQSGGWIGIDKFGLEASRDASLLVQHADKDPHFQIKTLELVSLFFKAGKVEAAQYAYLYDRVQVYLNKPQKFGSQGDVDSHDGIWKPWPCETTNLQEIDLQAIGIGMKRLNGDAWTLSGYFNHMNDGKVVPFSFLPDGYPKLEPI